MATTTRDAELKDASSAFGEQQQKLNALQMRQQENERREGELHAESSRLAGALRNLYELPPTVARAQQIDEVKAKKRDVDAQLDELAEDISGVQRSIARLDTDYHRSYRDMNDAQRRKSREAIDAPTRRVNRHAEELQAALTDYGEVSMRMEQSGDQFGRAQLNAFRNGLSHRPDTGEPWVIVLPRMAEET